jgi:hypothetical protein
MKKIRDGGSSGLKNESELITGSLWGLFVDSKGV